MFIGTTTNKKFPDGSIPPKSRRVRMGSLPRDRKCEKKHSAAGEQRAKKNDHILYISEYHTQLAKMSFDEIFDLTAGVYFHFL